MGAVEGVALLVAPPDRLFAIALVGIAGVAGLAAWRSGSSRRGWALLSLAGAVLSEMGWSHELFDLVGSAVLMRADLAGEAGYAIREGSPRGATDRHCRVGGALRGHSQPRASATGAEDASARPLAELDHEEDAEAQKK